MSLFNIGFIIFPDLTQLDFTGPLQVLSRLPQSATHIVAKSKSPVPSDCGLGLVPTHTFANCPSLDLLCVPGGSYGVVRAIGDRETIEFVRRQAGAAKYVSSICTGAFILGVAGLLKGRRATTHWAFTDLLPLVGASHEKAKVVRDGNVITAGGVTSGIDFRWGLLAVLFSALLALSLSSPCSRCPGREADQTHREAYAGLHRRVRAHGAALSWRESRQTGSKTGGASRGSGQEKWLCEPRRIRRRLDEYRHRPFRHRPADQDLYRATRLR